MRYRLYVDNSFSGNCKGEEDIKNMLLMADKLMNDFYMRVIDTEKDIEITYEKRTRTIEKTKEW